MNKVKIRKFKKSDVKKCVELVKKTYLVCNNREGSKQGVQQYVSRLDISDKQKLEAFANAPIFYVAENENKLVGLIKGRKDRITNLFVLPQEQGQGIGRLLVERFEKECKKYKPKTIKIRASLFAIRFYERRGYKKSTGIRNFHGLKIRPMTKTINK